MTAVEVPEDIARRLRHLRGGDSSQLDLACAVAAARGYSMASVARVLGVTREVVRRRVDRGNAADPEAVESVKPDERAERPARAVAVRSPYGYGRRKAQEVPEELMEHIARLRELWPSAFRRRASHPEDSEEATASNEVDRICALLYYDENITSQAIAAAVGASPTEAGGSLNRRAVENRAKRYALKVAPPPGRLVTQ